MVKRQQISDEVWNDNYRAPGESSLEDTWERQARACAQVESPENREKAYKDFLWLLTDFRGIAGGRITANLGVSGREATSIYNCFVHSPADIGYQDPDSIEGIYDMLKAQALTLKSEGGYGMNFSWIRPAGAYVKGIAGRTPGVLKFMELWDKSSEVITMGSEKVLTKKDDEKKKIRKGAQMACLSCHHPEIEDFIVAKQTPGRLTKFNMSVGITPGFMEAVEADGDWDLIFPDTTHPQYKTIWGGDIEDWKARGLPIVVHKTIKARDLWDKIMKSTYNRNEPGVLFLDVVNKRNPLYYAENVMTTNPCFHGDTLIAVADGRNAVPIRQLAEDGLDVAVYSINPSGKVEIKWGRQPRVTGENQKLVRVHLDEGSFVDVTLNHKFLVLDGDAISKKETVDLVPGDVLPRFRKVEDVADSDGAHKVVRVENLDGLHTVYNITVDDNHTVGIVSSINKTNKIALDGLFTANCGEIAMSCGVCLLFSLNLTKYIKKTDKFEFDFDEFRKASEISVRFADNINDISRVPIDDYRKSMQEKRRVGIGVVGLGSLLAVLGIRYGSKEGIELTDKIFKTKAETEILTSAKLGKEKGSFPLFDKDKYFSSYWWKTLPISETVKNQVQEIGCMRNSHRSANAPTGNMSIYAGVLSGGIEPIFMLEYARWGIVTEGVRAELRTAGFQFPDVFKGEFFETEHLKKAKAGNEEVLLGEFNGVQYQVDRNRGLTKKSIVEDWSWSFIKENLSKEEIQDRISKGLLGTTSELSHKEHVDMLKCIAQYVDMASSKTINIPNDYPYEDFKDIYMDAWKAGIKGLTTYRAGTMTAVLESAEDSKEAKRTAPKRPKELTCNIHTAKVNGHKWVVIIGLLNNEPYEIFAGPAENIDVKNGQIGSIIKRKRGEYCLQIDGEILSVEKPDEDGKLVSTSNIVNILDDPSSAWATRLVSMSLRHGVPIDFTCEQLNKDGFITDINKVLARILKKYSPSERKVEKVCPSCGSKNIKLDEGCLICMDCSFGKCG